MSLCVSIPRDSFRCLESNPTAGADSKQEFQDTNLCIVAAVCFLHSDPALDLSNRSEIDPAKFKPWFLSDLERLLHLPRLPTARMQAASRRFPVRRISALSQASPSSSLAGPSSSYFLAALPWRITDETDRVKATKGASFISSGDDISRSG